LRQVEGTLQRAALAGAAVAADDHAIERKWAALAVVFAGLTVIIALLGMLAIGLSFIYRANLSVRAANGPRGGTPSDSCIEPRRSTEACK
jgi:hypothetical protein